MTKGVNFDSEGEIWTDIKSKLDKALCKSF